MQGLKPLLAIFSLCLVSLNCSNGRSQNETLKPIQTHQSIRKEIGNELIDLNSADASELEKLPEIGEKLARRIVQHREKFGKFRRAEHVIIVKGMSDRKYRKIQHLITAR